MLTLNNLTYHYQSQTMCFSLHAEAGERVAILGPSGAGKSTLLSMIAGFLPLSSGELWIDGKNCTRQPPAQRPVSMLFQENNLFAHLTAGQNLGLGLHPGLRLTNSQKQQVTKIAASVGLQGLLDRLPGQLSEDNDNGSHWPVVCYGSNRYCYWMSLFRPGSGPAPGNADADGYTLPHAQYYVTDGVT